MYAYTILTAASIVTSAVATFALDIPQTVGTNLDTEHMSPCGGFNVTEDSAFMDWPTGGHDVRVVGVSDSSSVFSLKVALLSDPSNFVTLYPDITTASKGELCWSRIYGKADTEWMGQRAIFQVSQYAGNGLYNFQCAAVRFIEGDQAPSECQHSG
ncbi:hypothetical protein F4809DRAFT_638006 [Biscogniauxia mediterranea]|nr:hypothetical protein F4809DRAFT_638006 [Biscogniauxia mediterranea]